MNPTLTSALATFGINKDHCRWSDDLKALHDLTLDR